jgi:hypothetical protein
LVAGPGFMWRLAGMVYCAMMLLLLLLLLLLRQPGV